MKTTEVTILEDNRLIAEFMDGVVVNTGTEREMIHFPDFKNDDAQCYMSNSRSIFDLHYHTSWDWLMPVVERIESIGVGNPTDLNDVFVTLFYGTCEIYVQTNNIKDKYNYKKYYYRGTYIENMYRAVTDFIKWYNLNK